MSRVVLAWELGSNLGHLSRLLPLAVRLKRRGHSPLIISRDLSLAANVFAEAGIPYLQAPMATSIIRSTRPLASYAEILWHQGWADRAQLWGLVQGWANLLRMFKPHVAVLDHSPTAALAARATRTPMVLIGSGFEIPPRQHPLPAFAGGGLDSTMLEDTESRVLEQANWVLGAMQIPPMSSLRELLDSERRYLTTFAELDHYGSRAGEKYIGPIGELATGDRMAWLPQSTHRLFVYLRMGSGCSDAMLGALRASQADVICVLPGASRDIVDRFSTPSFRIACRPIQLDGLLESANLCVSYAPSGTVTAALLKGVPQLMCPQYPEARLFAERVEKMGAGLMMGHSQTEPEIGVLLTRLLTDTAFKTRAHDFAAKYRGYDVALATDFIVDQIERPARPSGVLQTLFA